jgi:NAD(P)-dependent dehydrogenase (short-subunit alcohol dehydrogenase family)
LNVGLATAKLLLDQGARVLVTGSTKKTLDSAREELGKNAIVMSSDARVLTDIDALAARAKSEFGAVDFLFVNAGYGKFAPFEGTSEAMYDEMFNLNMKGPYFAAQKFAPLMPPGSAIVLTTSIANEKGMPGVSAYAAPKPGSAPSRARLQIRSDRPIPLLLRLEALLAPGR